MNQLIHAAVRRDLDRLAAALEQLPAGDRRRAQELARAYAYLRGELTHHHEAEDILIWPMLQAAGVEASLLAAMESEHHAMSAALSDTGTALSALAATGTSVDVAAARASVARTRQVVDEHLGHEETDLEPRLAEHADSDEWRAVEKKLRQRPLAASGSFFAWLIDGMDAEQRVSLRQIVPTPVVTVLAKGFGRRYSREIAVGWRTA